MQVYTNIDLWREPNVYILIYNIYTYVKAENTIQI